MRRRNAVLVALLVGMCVAASASAANRVAGHESLEGQFAFGVSGGIVKPIDPIGSEPNWSATGRSSGLDLRYGWDGAAHADFFMTTFLSAGLWYSQSDMRMRPQTLYSSAGGGTYYMLVRGRTSLVGMHVTGYLPGERSWTPYAFVGVARYFRKVDLSSGMQDLAPSTTVLNVTDDCIGYDAGVGFEQPLTRSLGITTGAHYFYSGGLKHDLQWMGHDSPVDSWQFWSAEVGLTWHAPPRPAPAAN